MFEINGETYTLDAMLSSNADDESLCEWLKSAQVGEVFADMETVTRVA